ncbi:hypothetical protein [Falsirhodobacter sp. 1013]|uniref:hypothetical protein n=1 Tax=Falsirhodobacter sp. 1013 TaxID=3417566 RepID=UPI003EB94C41
MIAALVVFVAVVALNTILDISLTPFTALEGLSLVATLVALLGVVSGMIVGFWIYAMMLRMSVMLPAAAVGSGFGPRQALGRMRRTSGTMVMLLLLMSLMAIVMSVPIILAYAVELFLLANVLEFALNWFLTFLGISVLTTLYGHYVKGRALN